MTLEELKNKTKDAVDFLVQSLHPDTVKCSLSTSAPLPDSIPTRSAMSC